MYLEPDGYDSHVDDLLELPAEYRTTLESEAITARAKGEFAEEFDISQPGNMGSVDWLKAGVKCGVNAPRGPSTGWFVKSNQQDYRDYLEMALKSSGALVTVRDPKYPGPLGRVVGVAQTARVFVIRAHDCEYFVQHHPGRSPAGHVGLRDELRAKKRDETRKWIALALTAITVVVGVIWRIATL